MVSERTETGIYCPRAYTISPRNMMHTAVMCGRHTLLFPNDRNPLNHGEIPPARSSWEASSAPEDIGQLALWALRGGIENVWILPGPWAAGGELVQRIWSRIASVPALQAAYPEYKWHELTSRGLLDAELAGVVVQAQSGGPICTIRGPRALDQWEIHRELLQLAEDDRPAALAAAWSLTAHALGVRLRFGPSYCGLLLLRRILAGADRPFPKPSERYAELIDAYPAHPLVLAAAPRERVWPDPGRYRVWSYDRNWSYVTAARVVPVGDPEPVAQYVGSRPGLYKINAWAPRGWEGPGLIWTNGGFYPSMISDTWIWEPQLRLARAAGWHIDIIEGYAWVARGTVYDLRPWQDALWSARRAVTSWSEIPGCGSAGRMARAMVNAVGRAAIGRLNQTTGRHLTTAAAARDAGETVRSFASGGAVESETSLGRDDLSRPEWWSTIIANASERVQTFHRGQCPGDGLMDYIDACYVPRRLPDAKLAHPDTAGGWHMEADGVEIPADVATRGEVNALVNAVAAAKREAKHGE